MFCIEHDALEKSGVTLDEVRAYLAAHPRARHPTATHRGFMRFGFETSAYRECGGRERIAVSRDDPELQDVVGLCDDSDKCTHSGVYSELHDGFHFPPAPALTC